MHQYMYCADMMSVYKREGGRKIRDDDRNDPRSCKKGDPNVLLFECRSIRSGSRTRTGICGVWTDASSLLLISVAGGIAVRLESDLYSI